MLEELHERLAGVVIERLPWRTFMERYDRPGTLFYLDPPYYGCEDDYGPGMFGPEEFEAMAEVLAQLQGRFVLSINDTPEIRAMFGRFKSAPVDLTYRISGAPTAAKELIVTSG
jgi:DNA adenine methylase